MTKRATSRNLSARAVERGALGAVVMARREELGLRQEEVAELADCSARFVHTVEAGKTTLRLDKLLDVLTVLGLRLELARGAQPAGVIAGEAIAELYGLTEQTGTDQTGPA